MTVSASLPIAASIGRARMRALRRAARLALAAAIAAAPLAASARPLQPFPESAFRPALVDGAHVPDVRAAWNLPGYGYLIDVHRGSDDVNVYDYAGGLCWRDPLASGAAANALVAYYARSWRDFDTVFANAPDGRQFHAGWLPLVPSPCTRRAHRDSLLYTFDAVTSSFVELYPYSAERDIDWAQRRAALRSRAMAAQSPEELKAIFTEFMQGLEDPHTGINGTIDDGTPGGLPFEIGSQAGKATFHHLRALHAASHSTDDFYAWLAQVWQKQDYAGVSALFDRSRPSSLDGHVPDLHGFLVWGVLEGGNVGYVSFGQMMGFEEGADLARERELAGAAIDAVLAQLKDTDALVVDVSTTLGGYAEVAADLAARFADQRRLAYTTQAPGARGTAPQPYYVTPAGASHYAKPVLLLTSDMTVSAGERFVLLMRALPNVLHVGQATQGALNGGLGKGLPNGWEFGMPNEVLRDAQGVVHEVAGIAPSVAFDVFPADDFDDGHVKAVQRAAQLGGAP